MNAFKIPIIPATEAILLETLRCVFTKSDRIWYALMDEDELQQSQLFPYVWHSTNDAGEATIDTVSYSKAEPDRIIYEIDCSFKATPEDCPYHGKMMYWFTKHGTSMVYNLTGNAGIAGITVYSSDTGNVFKFKYKNDFECPITVADMERMGKLLDLDWVFAQCPIYDVILSSLNSEKI